MNSISVHECQCVPTGPGTQAAPHHNAQDQGRMSDLLDAIDIMGQQEADQVCYAALIPCSGCLYDGKLVQLSEVSWAPSSDDILLGCELGILHQIPALLV